MKKYILSLGAMMLLMSPVLAEEVKPAQPAATPAQSAAPAKVEPAKKAAVAAPAKVEPAKKVAPAKKATVKKAKSKTQKIQ